MRLESLRQPATQGAMVAVRMHKRILRLVHGQQRLVRADMMRTVYVAMRVPTVAAPAPIRSDGWSNQGNVARAEAHIPYPKVVSSKNRAHIDPLCPQFVVFSESGSRSVPAEIYRTEGYAVLLRQNGAVHIPLCNYCRSSLDVAPIEDQEWRKDALCSPSNLPEWAEGVNWFGIPSASWKRKRTNAATARRVCEECPVSVECLDYAVLSAQPLGIWGGVLGSERKRLVARARAAG